MTSSNKVIFVADGGKDTLSAIDFTSGNVLKTAQLTDISGSNALEVSPDASVLAVAEKGNGITFIDANALMISKRVSGAGDVLCVAWSLDEKLISAGSRSGEVVIIEPGTYSIIRKAKHHSDCVYKVAFSPSSRVLVSGSFDFTAVLYKSHDLTVIKNLKGHSHNILCAAFIDENRLMTGGADKSIRVWDTQSGSNVHTILGHTNWVYCLDVSSDGSSLLSGGGDNKLCIHDASTYQLTKTIECNGPVNSLQNVDSDLVLLGVCDSEMVAVDIKTGNVAMNYTEKYRLPSGIVLGNSKLMPASANASQHFNSSQTETSRISRYGPEALSRASIEKTEELYLFGKYLRYLIL